MFALAMNSAQDNNDLTTLLYTVTFFVVVFEVINKHFEAQTLVFSATTNSNHKTSSANARLTFGFQGLNRKSY